MFFTVVNPIDNQDSLWKPHATCHKQEYRHTEIHGNTFQNTLFWCNLKLAQQRGLQFYQTRSNAVILHHTVLAEFIEKAICMKTKDQLYRREIVNLGPRVVLKAKSKSGSQDPPAQEVRSSRYRNKMRRATGETRSNTADHRIPGISISTMKLQDARRQNNVTQLIVDINQTEIFELCENSAKLECPDYNAISEIGIIYCSCGRNLKYKRSPTTNQKADCDFTSIPSFVIKKNSRRGPKHGVSERQVMFHRAKQMLKKARQAKHGNHPTKLSRWYEQEGYRKSLAEHNIGEKELMLFDRIALERHDYTATRAERLQNAKHWILRLIADGPQKPLRKRQDFADALKQCLYMQDAHLAETQQSLRPKRPEHQQRQRQN